MAIANATVTSGIPGKIYQSNNQNAVTAIMFCNNSPINTSLSMWMVPSGQALATSMQVLAGISMPAGETFSIDSERFILENGDSVYAQVVDSNTVQATISYMPTN